MKCHRNLITITPNHIKLHKSHRFLICTFSVCADRQTAWHGETDKRRTKWYSWRADYEITNSNGPCVTDLLCTTRQVRTLPLNYSALESLHGKNVRNYRRSRKNVCNLIIFQPSLTAQVFRKICDIPVGPVVPGTSSLRRSFSNEVTL